MDNNELERRKNVRRQHRKCKDLDRHTKYREQKDEFKIKKQFKNYKQKLIEEELWEEWENEIG